LIPISCGGIRTFVFVFLTAVTTTVLCWAITSFDISVVDRGVSYRRCGRNLREKLYTVINSLSANHARPSEKRSIA